MKRRLPVEWICLFARRLGRANVQPAGHRRQQEDRAEHIDQEHEGQRAEIDRILRQNRAAYEEGLTRQTAIREALSYCIFDIGLARVVGDVIQVAGGVAFIEVDGRRKNAARKSQNRRG